MTSPNFHPEDVKVGSRIRCSDGIVREVKEFVHDTQWQTVGLLFTDKVVLKWEELQDASIAVDDETTPTEQRLTALILRFALFALAILGMTTCSVVLSIEEQKTFRAEKGACND